MAVAQTLADQMLERVVPERYLPDHERRSAEKTRPVGGGRTPIKIAKWESFEEDLLAWWTAASPPSESLANVLSNVQASLSIPANFLRHGAIVKKDEVRGALAQCVFNPVNEVQQRVLGGTMLLNATESIRCVRSNADWACFNVNLTLPDIFIRCAMPIEIKPPWQLKLEAGEHAVDLLISQVQAEHDKVRFGIAQTYLYMILEESVYAVLCSKEQYIFLQRFGNPEEKALMITKTYACDDAIGIRRCVLFMCHLAMHSGLASRADTDEARETPLYEKLFTPGQSRTMRRDRIQSPMVTRSRAAAPAREEVLESQETDLRPPSQTRSEREASFARSETPIVTKRRATTQLRQDILEESPKSGLRWWSLTEDESNILSGKFSVEPSCWIRRPNDTHAVEDWFQGLSEFDVFSLQLGGVLSSAGKVVVREGYIWGQHAAIKMFDVAEGPDMLEQFHKEVCAYHSLEAIQGRAVPRMLVYGSLWGGFMGFFALAFEGNELTKDDFQMQPNLFASAVSALQSIHETKVLHGDVSFGNVVLSSVSRTVMWIDFGQCKLGVDEESLMEELENLKELLSTDSHHIL